MTSQPPLVSVHWLSENLSDDRLIVIDSSVQIYERDDGLKDSRPRYSEYIEQHIPGAVFADLLNDFSIQRQNARFGIPKAEEFEQAASALGVSNSTWIVVYSSANMFWATRLWWLFRYFGHNEVSILNGGLQAWISEGLEVRSGEETNPTGSFAAAVQNHRLATKDDVLAIVKARESDAVIVDVLSPEYFRGDLGNIYGYRRLGHIAGAVNIPISSISGNDPTCITSTKTIEALVAEKIGDKHRPVITYCGGGIAATQMALALETAGYENVRVYSGSLQEWSADPSLPMSTGEI